MKKSITILTIAIIVSTVAVSCGKGSSSGARVIKVAWVLPADHPTSQAMTFFKEQLEKKSQGKIQVKLFANGVLGDATGCLEGLKAGNIEMSVVSAAPLSQFVKEFNVMTMPFLFRDKQHEYQVVDGDIGQKLAGKLSTIGAKGLGYFDAGSRNVMTKTGPIASPDDLKGKKIRVMSSKLMIDTLNSMEASAVAMGQGEVYSALQTGVLDGWENNPPTALTFKMYETGCKHFAWTRHLAVPDVIIINEAFLNKLPEDQKKLVLEVAKETMKKQRELWRAAEQDAIKKLEKAGMVFTEVDQQVFAQKVDPLYQRYYKENGDWFKELCEGIRNTK